MRFSYAREKFGVAVELAVTNKEGLHERVTHAYQSIMPLQAKDVPDPILWETIRQLKDRIINFPRDRKMPDRDAEDWLRELVHINNQVQGHPE